MAYKPVGIDENGYLPSRAKTRLSSNVMPTGCKFEIVFDFTDPNIARPTGVPSNCALKWRGPSEPVNMVVGDTFLAVTAATV